MNYNVLCKCQISISETENEVLFYNSWDVLHCKSALHFVALAIF